MLFSDEISIPWMGLDYAYMLSHDRAVVAAGDGTLDAILDGTGTTPAGEVLHVAIRPREIPDDAWSLILQYAFDNDDPDSQARTIKRLYKWDAGNLDATLDGDDLVISLSGTRHP